MSTFFLSAISCVCIVHAGLCAGECVRAVLGRRETFYVSVGSSLSLSCVVQHCESPWKGNWRWENGTDQSEINSVKESKKHRFTSVTISINETRLEFQFQSVDKSDEGAYRCDVKWDEDVSAVGHWMHVNVTKAVLYQRQFLHRVLVCVGASICFPAILGLACCLSSRVKPQPHPRLPVTYTAVQRNPPQPPPRCPVPQKRSIPAHKAQPKLQQKTEVVYADISQQALEQCEAIRKPEQPTVYSSLRFS